MRQPDFTALKLDDELVRYRWASTFFTVGRTLREELDFDYASEQMILGGALDRYKVLLFLWGAITEKPVLERMDQWVRKGGTLVFAPRPRGLPGIVEGDTSIAGKWWAGDTGKGRVVLWRGDLLHETSSLHLQTRSALRMEKPSMVFWSMLENGRLALLNFGSRPASVRLVDGKTITIAPCEMALD